MSWMNEWTNECVSSVKAIRMICGLLLRTWLDSHKYSGPTQWCTPEEGNCWNLILHESHTECSKQCHLKEKRSVTCNVSWVQWKCFTVGFPGYSLYVSKQADRMIGGSSGKNNEFLIFSLSWIWDTLQQLWTRLTESLWSFGKITN